MYTHHIKLKDKAYTHAHIQTQTIQGQTNYHFLALLKEQQIAKQRKQTKVSRPLFFYKARSSEHHNLHPNGRNHSECIKKLLDATVGQGFKPS